MAGYMKDTLRDYIPYATNIAWLKVRQAMDTFRTRVLAAWWGIEIGETTVSCGIPIFRRHPNARIVLGQGCRLNSAEWSNTIGLNRRCVIAASRNATIMIGDRCGFSATVIAASTSITIGNRVLCGGNCTIVDTDRHPINVGARARSERPESPQPIVIGDDVFLSMNVVVLKGCTIGQGTVVAANSVVTNSLPAGVIAGGVPARVIRTLRDEEW